MECGIVGRRGYGGLCQMHGDQCGTVVHVLGVRGARGRGARPRLSDGNGWLRSE